MITWDPSQYSAFADERSLPFHHLVAAVSHLRPRRVLDIGCGSGALTVTLLTRWPAAEILGIDSSVEMIEHARRRMVTGRLSLELTDIRNWVADEAFDLVLSNACLHWIEDHRLLLDHITTLMADTATLAFQVPANHDQPSHTILAGLCSSDGWRDLLGDAFRVHVQTPQWYADELGDLGFEVNAWQTSYLHRLAGADPVLEWVKGTTLRPILDLLDQVRTEKFLKEYGGRLREAYPQREGETMFPFTRTFVVADRR